MRGSWANISKNRLIFVAIAVLTFCTVWIGYGLLESVKYEQQAKDKISEYTEYTREKIAQACAASDKIENIKCVNEAFAAKRAFEYNQSDLVAQRQSALWAYIMAAAAVFGIALSAVGVWLVKTTFDETRKANEIAKDTARKQLRPFVYVTKVDFDYTYGGQNDDTKFAFDIHIKNFGQTPAKNVTVKVCSFVRVYDDLDFSKNLTGAEVSQMNDIAPNFENWREDHPLTISFEDWQAVIAGTSCIYVDGVLEYHDAFGQEFTTEFRRLTLAKKVRKKTMLDAYSGNKAT